MNPHDYPTIVLALRSELDRKISELEATCFDLRADEVSTIAARSRRLQLIAVRDFIEAKAAQI